MNSKDADIEVMRKEFVTRDEFEKFKCYLIGFLMDREMAENNFYLTVSSRNRDFVNFLTEKK